MQHSRTVSAAIAYAVAALSLSLATYAQPLSPKRDAPPRGPVGASGGAVSYEESAGGRILYFEESGGMATAVTAPVKAKAVNGNGGVNASVNGGGAGKGLATPYKVAPIPVARTVPEKQ